MATVRDLTFGVEIETGVPGCAEVCIGGYHNGATLPNFPTNGTVRGTKWTASADSSIDVSGMRGCEFVSPILQGADGLDNLTEAINRIKALGARTNRTCGVHVHVGFPSNDLRALRRLVHLVAHWEAALFATTGTTAREANHFCASIKRPTMQTCRYTSTASVSTAAGCDRYRTLNLQPLLNGRGTVEFRLFSGSTNPKKVVAWAMLALSLVEAALNGTRAKSWDMPETSTARESGEGRGERLVRAMCNDLWVWNGRSETAGQYGHATYTHAFARRQLVRMGKAYDLHTEMAEGGDCSMTA